MKRRPDLVDGMEEMHAVAPVGCEAVLVNQAEQRLPPLGEDAKRGDEPAVALRAGDV